MVKIREFTEADLETCAMLYCRVFAAPPWNETWETAWALARLTQILATPTSLGLVMEDEAGAVIGFGAGFFEPWRGNIEFYLKEFCIAPELQRQGLGSQLMAALEARSQEAGASNLYLLTARGDISELFYQKLGFYTSAKMIMMAKNITTDPTD